MMYEEGEYYSVSSEVFTCINSISNSNLNLKKKKMMNKRRFSDDQVKSLESIFENENKLEPKKKMELARELGLEPRQVAIWFQNKRARYKSKQLEHEYGILRANYNTLASQFDNLKKEKNSLLIQIQKLKDIAARKGEGEENQYSCNETNSNNSNDDSQSENEKWESENTKKKCDVCEDQKPTLSLDGSEYGASMSMLSDEGSSENNTNYFGDEAGMDILTMVDPVNVVGAAAAGGSLTSAEASWDELRHDGLFDQAVDSCQWWEFWS